MDVQNCIFIAKSNKYRHSQLMFHAFKEVVYHITSTDNIPRRSEWISSLSSFDANDILWNKNGYELVLLLASCLPLNQSKKNFHVIQFLCQLNNVGNFNQFSKFICYGGEFWGPMEWKAIRNLCNIGPLQLSIELSILKITDAVLQEFTLSKNISNWKSTVTSFELFRLEAAMLSIFGILKVYVFVALPILYNMKCSMTSLLLL